MTDTVATLTTAPWFDVVTTHRRRAVATPASTGHLVRRQVQSSTSRNSSEIEIRVWGVEWKVTTPTEKAHILSCFNAAIGRAFPISWTPPGVSVALAVKFVDDILDIEHIGGQTYRIRTTLEEVI